MWTFTLEIVNKVFKQLNGGLSWWRLENQEQLKTWEEEHFLHFSWYDIAIILIWNILWFLQSWNHRAFTFHIKLHLNVIFDNKQKRNHMHSPYIYPFDFDILLYLCFILWSTALTPIPFFCFVFFQKLLHNLTRRVCFAH